MLHFDSEFLTGTNINSSKNGAIIASKFKGKLYSTAGVHPHDAKNCTSTFAQELKTIAMKNEVVAIGECGLDYNRDFSPRDVQRKVFKEQIDLAITLNKPLFLHERDAFSDFHSILKEYRSKISNLVVHCFTGTEEELNAYLNLDSYIGITGWICDERRGKNLRSLLKKIPLNRLMIETDAPFLTPRDLPIKPLDGRNEPKYLIHILNEISKSINVQPDELAKITRENTLKFFNINP